MLYVESSRLHNMCSRDQVAVAESFGMFLTSKSFGDSMSAAARPKRWGMSRQAKGQKFDPTEVELLTLLDGTCLLRVLGVTWGCKRKENDIHTWIASDGSPLLK
jgi:hypothetical protein